MGRSFLGACIRFRRVDEVQEVDQCSAFRFESNSESSFYSVVVADNQSCKRKQLIFEIDYNVLDFRSMLVSKFSLTWLAFSCTARFRLSRSHWFKFSVLTCGRRFTSRLLWICAKCLIVSWMRLKFRPFRRRRSIRESRIKWTALVPTFCCLLNTSGKFRVHHCWPTPKTRKTARRHRSIGLVS